ncbi:MAG: hypothetical protein ISP32_08655 [Thermoleophilia bacterium]|nr:hypothetical protein [Thermoleophilia bacterium]
MWQFAELADYAEAAIFALVLVAISAVLTWFLVVRPALRSWAEAPDAGTPPVTAPPPPEPTTP